MFDEAKKRRDRSKEARSARKQKSVEVSDATAKSEL